MATITHISNAFKQLFGEKLEDLARKYKFIQRQSVVTGAGFVKTLVMAFLANPTASYSEMSSCASSLQMPISAQGLAQRFDENSAQFLKAVLDEALAIRLPEATAQALPLLQRFEAVHIRDSSSIALPAELQSVWAGNGGRTGPTAALKLQVSWEQCRGQLDGITLQAGRSQDKTSPYQQQTLARGALHIGDLGFFSLEKLAADDQAGVLWLTRLKFGCQLFTAEGEPLDLVAYLKAATSPVLELSVQVGRTQKLAGRLLASRVPQEVADQRRRRLRADYRKKGKVPSEALLALAGWTLILTNVPASDLSHTEALALLKIRWQIELLFKIWKSYLGVTQWASRQPWRILTEVYAKLLTGVLFHWTVLTEFWGCPDHSLMKAVQLFRRLATPLLLALTLGADLGGILEALEAGYLKACRIKKRPNRKSTFQILTEPEALLG